MATTITSKNFEVPGEIFLTVAGIISKVTLKSECQCECRE